jgi:hypothetical protein
VLGVVAVVAVVAVMPTLSAATGAHGRASRAQLAHRSGLRGHHKLSPSVARLLKGRAVPRSHRAARDVIAHFRLLRRANRGATVASGTDLPAGLLAVHSSEGLDPSRTVAVNDGNMTVWFVPGSAGSCMTTETDGTYMTSCGVNNAGPNPVSEDGLMAIQSVTPVDGSRSTRLVAVVPDGNSTVSLVRADGTSADIPVVDNVVVADLSPAQGFVRWTFLTASGAVATRSLGQSS